MVWPDVFQNMPILILKQSIIVMKYKYQKMYIFRKITILKKLFDQIFHSKRCSLFLKNVISTVYKMRWRTFIMFAFVLQMEMTPNIKHRNRL